MPTLARRITQALFTAALATAGLALPVFGFAPAADAATTYRVTSTADGLDLLPGDGVCATAQGECTLRAAIEEANRRPGSDTIVLGSGTYGLTIPGVGENDSRTGDLDVRDNVTIVGGGSDVTTIDARRLDRVFHLHGGHLAVHGVTVTGGRADCGHVDLPAYGLECATQPVAIGEPAYTLYAGGGVYARPGSRLTVQDSVITANSARDAGGGVAAFGATVSLVNAEVTGNRSGDHAGGLLVDGGGGLSMAGSTVEDNVATYRGGGLQILSANGDIRDSLISANEAGWTGGGIEVDYSGATVTVRRSLIEGNRADRGAALSVLGWTPQTTRVEIHDSTISGNVARYESIVTSDEALVRLVNVTATANQVPGGRILFADGFPGITGIVEVGNSVVTANGGAPACGIGTFFSPADGEVRSLGHNVTGDDSCGTAAGDIVTSDARLGALSDNGGPTRTHALLSGSPARDAGDATLCSPADQRGIARSGPCDAGAYEAQ